MGLVPRKKVTPESPLPHLPCEDTAREPESGPSPDAEFPRTSILPASRTVRNKCLPVSRRVHGTVSAAQADGAALRVLPGRRRGSGQSARHMRSRPRGSHGRAPAAGFLGSPSRSREEGYVSNIEPSRMKTEEEPEMGSQVSEREFREEAEQVGALGEGPGGGALNASNTRRAVSVSQTLRGLRCRKDPGPGVLPACDESSCWVSCRHNRTVEDRVVRSH